MHQERGECQEMQLCGVSSRAAAQASSALRVQAFPAPEARDTTSANARRGEDLQGIPWDAATRQRYRVRPPSLFVAMYVA